MTLSYGVSRDHASRKATETHHRHMNGGRTRSTVDRSQPSFAAFYETNAEPVLRYCRVRIANPAEAEDVAAAVFAKAFAAWPPSEPAAARQWIYAIAHNAVANHYRTQSNRPAARPIDDSIVIPDRSASPHDIVAGREEQQQLHAAIEELTEDQQEVIRLRLAGLSGPEIADATGRSHAAVKMLQLRAMQSLRKLLTRHDETPSAASRHDERDRR